MVPLVGLEKDVEDDIVHLGMNGSSEHPVQKSLSGVFQPLLTRVILRIHYIHPNINSNVFFSDLL